MRDKVTVGWISPGKIDDPFAHSLLWLNTQRGDRIDGFISVAGSLLSRQRNELVARFLDGDGDWLLMVDTDEVVRLESFDKLVDAAHDKDRPIVAGLYFGTLPTGGLIPHPVPHLYRHHHGAAVAPVLDYPRDEVIEIDACGTGAVLVHRSVFETIRDTADEHEGTDWCWFRDLPINGNWLGEDIYFCRRAKAAGFKLHAHTGAIFDHHRSYWLNDVMFEASRALAHFPTAVDDGPMDIPAKPSVVTARAT